MGHIGENTKISDEILKKNYLQNEKTISGTKSAISSGYDNLSNKQIKKIKDKFNYFETKNIEEYLEYKK